MRIKKIFFSNPIASNGNPVLLPLKYPSPQLTDGLEDGASRLVS